METDKHSGFKGHGQGYTVLNFSLALPKFCQSLRFSISCIYKLYIFTVDMSVLVASLNFERYSLSEGQLLTTSHINGFKQEKHLLPYSV